MIHHQTIRKYTAALLNFLNDIEIQYNDSTGATISRSVPIRYSSREKSNILADHDMKKLLAGNTNILPRANLSLSTMTKIDARSTNKNLKTNTVKKDESFDFMYNSVPYEFTYEIAIMCRGMNEATMIIEQFAPKFNPTFNIDIWDAENLDEPTRIPVKLLDIGIETEEYEEISANLVGVNIGISLTGNMYPPIKSVERVKDFKIYLNNMRGDYYSRDLIKGWDIDDNGKPQNETTTIIDNTETIAPVIINIVAETSVVVGDSNLTVIFDDTDHQGTELTFDWVILSGDASITTGNDDAVLTVNADGDVEVEVTVTDPDGNYASMSKTYTVTTPVP